MQYIRISATRILYLDNNGHPAAGYPVWTCLADSTTLASTWTDKDLSALNTNPIILDPRGQAEVFSNAVRKLVLCEIGSISPADSVLQEDDYLGDNLISNVILAGTTPGTTNNHYRLTYSPTITSLLNNQMVIFTPDVDSVSTIGTAVFTGSGINDATFSGPYIGSTSGSTVTVKIDTGVVDSPGALSAALAGTGVGLLTNGVYSYVVTYVTGLGESAVGTASAGVTVVDNVTNGKISLSNIPVSTNSTVTARKIYRTKAGGSIYYLVTTISDNITTTYLDNIADASITILPPTPYTPGAPTAALAGIGAGQLTNGAYQYLITFATTSGESAPGVASAVVTVVDKNTNGQVALSNIPVASQTVITSRKVYRTKVGGSVYFYIAEIPDNTTTTYTDNIPDTSLTVLAPVASSLPDTFSWRKDGGAWTVGVPITGLRQVMIENVGVTFAELIGHTVGDIWAAPLTAPVMIDLGSIVIDASAMLSKYVVVILSLIVVTK